MPELTPKERLQPSLLDRLTDNEPDQRLESREQRVLSPARLRESVSRDLGWLFNAIHFKGGELDRFPEVERSTLNYGLPDLAGRTISSIDIEFMERTLRRVITDFEPRLIKSSVKVRVTANPEQMGQNALCFSIEADLWSQPVPLRLYLRTEFDLEDGSARVSEVGSSDAI
jgi:type VI secretion system protein ImpF